MTFHDHTITDDDDDSDDVQVNEQAFNEHADDILEEHKSASERA